MDKSGEEEPVWLKSRNVLDRATPLTLILDKNSASASEVLRASCPTTAAYMDVYVCICVIYQI